MEPIIRARALTKRYGAARGIEDVTFDVAKGEVFGFLGPNGAGKTTTIRLLLDVVRPTSGSVTVLGRDATKGARDIHARVGYLPGDLGLAERLTVQQQLDHWAGLRGGVDRARVRELADRLQLDLARPVRALSRGNRQKVGIVQALMHDPELLVLDEPTSGLDPLMQREFNALVREAAQRGATVFLSSHILPEVESLCERVGIIREGCLVAVEGVAALKARALRRVRATFRGEADARRLEGVPGVQDVVARGEVLRCVVRGETGALVRALAGDDLVDLSTEEASLEDLFLAYYGEASA